MLSEIIERNILQVVIFCIFVYFPCKAVKIVRVITRNKYDFSCYFCLELILPCFLLSLLLPSLADSWLIVGVVGYVATVFRTQIHSDWLLSGQDFLVTP